MNHTATQQITGRTARILHAAMTGGVLVILAALYLLRGAVPVAVEGDSASIVRYVSLAVLILIGVVAYKLRMRIPAIEGDQDYDVWWAANGARVMLLWVVGEGTAALGGVIWLLTRDYALVVACIVGLMLLFEFRPSVWPTRTR